MEAVQEVGVDMRIDMGMSTGALLGIGLGLGMDMWYMDMVMGLGWIWKWTWKWARGYECG